MMKRNKSCYLRRKKQLRRPDTREREGEETDLRRKKQLKSAEK
jgi:hypothetical protein